MSGILPTNSPFFVAPTCIADTGLGLFAKKAFKKGELLPFQYPGIQVTRDAFEACNEDIYQLTNKKLGPRQHQLEVKRVFQQHGIQILETDSDKTPDWDVIYDKFIAYSMYIAESDKFIYWRCYRYDGKILPHEKDRRGYPDAMFDMSALHMNEPPPYAFFHNGYSGKGVAQKSCLNVEESVYCVNGIRSIQFIAAQDIEPFDELIYFYGTLHSRDYEINLNSVSKYVTDESNFAPWEQEDCKTFKQRIREYKDKGYLFVARPWKGK